MAASPRMRAQSRGGEGIPSAHACNRHAPIGACVQTNNVTTVEHAQAEQTYKQNGKRAAFLLLFINSSLILFQIITQFRLSPPPEVVFFVCIPVPASLYSVRMLSPPLRRSPVLDRYAGRGGPRSEEGKRRAVVRVPGRVSAVAMETRNTPARFNAWAPASCRVSLSAEPGSCLGQPVSAWSPSSLRPGGASG